MSSLLEKFFVLVDEFRHQHFAAQVGMNSVNRKFFVQRAESVVKVRLNVDVILLPLDVFVNRHKFCVPIRIRRRVESVLQVRGINRHERQINRANFILQAQAIDVRQVFDNVFGRNVRGSQAVRAG